MFLRFLSASSRTLELKCSSSFGKPLTPRGFLERLGANRDFMRVSLSRGAGPRENGVKAHGKEALDPRSHPLLARLAVNNNGRESADLRRRSALLIHEV